MLVPHAVDIMAVTIDLITHCFSMIHICRTIQQHFSIRQVKLCIGQRKYKQKFTNQGSTDQASEFVLTHQSNILHSAK